MYNQKGFTIFELIVVVAIITVVTGIFIPVYFSMKPTIRVNGAARQIQGDLMWARMRAVTENNDYVIAFGKAGTPPDLSNNTYYIYDDDDGNFITVGTETGELVKTVVIPDEYEEVGYGYTVSKRTDNTTDLTEAVTFNSGGATKPIWFKFEPNGRSNIPGGIYLILDEDQTNSRKDRSRAITVKTGRIKIYDYNDITDKWE
jgi:prepilin-type N-terminal cleavage/methylation domain-containing protein